MTLYIVRHGRTEANASGLLLGRADPELDEEGRKQAQQISTALPEGAIVVSSPLQRTRQTAEAVDPEHLTDDRLLEMDYGVFDLTPVKDVPADVWAQWRSDPDFAPPDGESHAQLATRVSAALDEWSAKAIDRDVVVVTHVSPIKASLAWALGVGIEVSWRSFVAQASISTIGMSDRGPSLHAFNATHHLS
ncbi:MAG: broad specificity phosphatase PhoE [Candidatus Poriferisodalaceae bacterium]|jgi:broad specificity phosphatase PhoE